MKYSMYEFSTSIRVRYYETDRMGYVHHAWYAGYFEIARTEMLRNMGLSYKSLEDSGIILPIRSLYIEYKSPAFYDDVLTIKVSLEKKPDIKLILHYEIFNQDNKLICTGTTTNVFVDAKTKKPIRMPDNIKVLFERFFDS